ncbi:transglycosylase SLT domain-containing protein [Paraburkholderia kururiensis]
MSRPSYALLFMLGICLHAGAEEPVRAHALASDAAAASATIAESRDAAASMPLASAASAAASDAGLAAGSATGPVAAQMHKISAMLTEKFGLAREKAQRISSAVMASAEKYSLPPALVLAIISIESRFKETARGAHGATGLMQVVPAAHRQLVKNMDLTEASDNIEAGSAILHGYLQSARGDVGAALKSYGGSSAYARKVSLRAKDFDVTPAASATDRAQ